MLRGFDDLDALELLLAKLLARRDQWLPRLAEPNPPSCDPLLEGALQRLVDDELAELAPLAAPPLFAELRAALQHAAAHATDERIRAAVEPWLAIDAAPPVAQSALAAWQGTAVLLLTREGEWRKQIREERRLRSAPRRRESALRAAAGRAT